MFGVALDQGFDEGGFADTGGPDNSDDDWGSFFREAVYEGDMETFFLDL